MIHPLVTQLRFARSEFVRCLEGVPAEDASRRLRPMNGLSWIVGHLASQEHYLWVEMAQGRDIASGLYALVGHGQPGSTPPWEDMWEAWRTVTRAADQYLDALTAEMLQSHLVREAKPISEDIGTTLLRNIYHYWYHLGEAHAVRAMLGHRDLPEFVGRMSMVRHSIAEEL
jgi:hypothetical protein